MDGLRRWRKLWSLRGSEELGKATAVNSAFQSGAVRCSLVARNHQSLEDAMEQLSISIATANPESLANFYSTVFGLEFKSSDVSGIAVRTTTLSGIELSLVPNAPPGSPPAAEEKGVHQFHVHAKDARKIFERAKKSGCVMHLSPDGKSAYIVDPAGYPWEIVELER
jgi:predicted enzyme related to lactoylglutathione lyase